MPALALRWISAASLGLWVALVCGGRALTAGESAPPAAPRSYALRAARIYTVAGPVIEDGVIVVRDGKIAALGRSAELALPGDLPVVNFASQTVIPGLIASSVPVSERGEATPSVSPEVLAADGFDYFDERRDLLAGGITTLGVSTGSSRLLSGRGLVVKVGGHRGDIRARILKREGAYHVTLGTYPRRPRSAYEPPVLASPDDPFRVVKLQAPVSRGGALSTLKGLFTRAKVHVEAPGGVEVSLKIGPGVDADPEAFRDLITGRATLTVRADRTIDLLRAVDLAREFDLSLVLVGAIEAYRIPERLAAAGVPVVVEGTFVPGQLSRDDLTRSSTRGDAADGLAARLQAAGVRVAITTADASRLPRLLLQCLEAVRYGMSPGAALRAVTLTPAEILGVQDRVGSLEAGKDADFVVLGEDPFEGGGRPVATFVSGEMVSPKVKEFPAASTVILCGRVCTASRGDIPGGVIVVDKGKILAVGDAALAGAFPRAGRIIDARSETVIPGLIDAGSQLGIHRDTDVPDASRQAPRAGGSRATFRLVDAIDFADPQLADVLRSGITTSILSPDPGGVFSGQLTAIKLAAASPDRAVVKDPVALLMGSVSASQLKRAKTYHDQWQAFEKAEEEKKEQEEKKKRQEELREVGRRFGFLLAGEETKDEGAGKEKAAVRAPTPNEDYDVLRSVFRGELPVVVPLSSDGAVPGVLSTLTDGYRTRTILYGFDEIHPPALAELRKRDVGVLVGSHPVFEKSREETVHLPRTLADAGIPFAFRSGSGSGARQLPLQVAYAVRRGWSAAQALESMTIYPARLFGIDDRVGSIEEGKDADLVFLHGEPFGIASRVTRVMVDGKLVYETQK